MKRALIGLLILCSCFNFLLAQIDRCSANKMIQQELLLNPDKKVILDQLESYTQEFIDNYHAGRIADTTYIIPVVVHVIHQNGPERIDMAQIESAIQSMNDDFNLLKDKVIETPTIKRKNGKTKSVGVAPCHSA